MKWLKILRYCPVCPVFWPVMLVVGYAAALAEKDKPDAEKKAAEPTP